MRLARRATRRRRLICRRASPPSTACCRTSSTKLQVLYQGVQADEQANLQRTRELVVAGHGQFAARFQPRP